MAKGRIRLISTIPGPGNLGPIVREFCRKEGVITAFSDVAVKTLAGLMPEESGNEAISFGSLARRFATLCGEMPLPVAHHGHAVAAIGLACTDLPPETPFSKTAHRLGLHEAIADTLHELSEYGLTPEEYEEIAARAEPIVASKLRSLGQIERQATDALRQLGRSFGREHYRLCQSSAPDRGAELGRILVLAGGDFSPQAVDLLKWAAAQGALITVVIYRHASAKDLFRGARYTAEALNTEAEECGDATELSRHLFTDSPSTAPDIRCTLVSAADALAEAEWALRTGLKKHQEGLAYEAMALYVRDSASYAPLLEASAKRLGVPIRTWRRAPLMTNSFARLTQAALEFCASRDVRSLMPLARTTYFSLGHEARQNLQTALKACYAKRAEQWSALREWVGERAEQFAWLSGLLDWREEAVASPANLEVWIGRLRALMSSLPLEEGTLGGRERDKRALFVLQQSLNMIASVRRLRQQRSITLSEFTSAAKEIWSEADVSIPAGEQGVLVTSHAESLPELRCLFVLGMLEGVFPRRRSEDPILSDFEREAISESRGGPRLPSSKDKAEAERDEFYMLCATASQEIVFSYPETDEERDNVPAFYLDEVERALGTLPKISRSRQELTPLLSECSALSDREICAAMESPDRAEALPLQFSHEATAGELWAGERPLRPNELTEALRCPFSFFARHTLDLRPERLRARWFSLASLPRAANLTTLASSELARTALQEALDKQLDGLYAEAPHWEIALLRSGGKRLIRDWVEREFTARRIWPKEEVRTQVAFGEEGLRETLPKIARLKGAVAATSRTGPYSVVHLVETSGPGRGFGPPGELLDEDKLYYGLHLLAAWDKNSASALEIETMSGERLLMLLPRLPGVDLPARVQEGLRVIDLGSGEESGGPKSFFEDVKKLAQEAAARIARVDVTATRGDHCAWCDYGELCRRSMEFGEEDSPFVDDL